MAAETPDGEVMGKAVDRTLLRRLVVYLSPYKWSVIGSIAMAIAAALLSAIRPYISKIAIDDHLLKGDFPGLLRLTAIMFGLLVIQGIIQYVLTLVMQHVGQETINRIRLDLFERLQKLSLRFYDTNPIGRLVTRVTSDVEVLNEFFASGLVMIAANIFIIVSIVIVMFGMSVKLSLVTLVSLPFLLWATSLFRKRVRVVYRDTRTQLSRMNAFINETITGAQTVKLFNQEDATFKQFDGINQAYTDAQVKSVFYYAVFFPVVDLLSQLAVGLIIWYGGREVISAVPDFGLFAMIRGWFGGATADPLTFGTLFAFLQFTEMFFRPIRDLSDKYNILQNTMASSERIFELLDEQAFAPEAKDPAPFGVQGGAIEFSHVDFSYDGTNQIVTDLSFNARPGETVAIVGATGAGKTSIINILLRFYEFSAGSVTIDGRDIRSIDTKDLRRDIALVMQDIFLFRGTILDNITLGDEHVSFEDAKRAAETVGVSRFIESLPEAYNTPVQERGSTFSVGQRQLLSFARALAHNPKILILDEATSSVDTETEQVIQRATEKLLEGRTSIVVAHRLSTIQNADRILVMHHGELRESGTHEQLLALGGIYATLYNLQYKLQEKAAA
ncbi:MAG: ABC transporter ATP-binding protein [Candidatus Kapaibacterium sp.]